jgi:hypothetical protein
MNVRKHLGAVILIATGLVAGSLLGPHAVQAAGQLVTIVSGSNNNQAVVTSDHRLAVDTEASARKIGGVSHLLVAARLSASPVVNEGNGNSDAAFCAVMTGIVVDGSNTGGTVILATEGTLVWKGTLPVGGGHLSDTFGTGVFTGEMDVTAPDGVDWIIYGRQC